MALLNLSMRFYVVFLMYVMLIFALLQRLAQQQREKQKRDQLMAEQRQRRRVLDGILTDKDGEVTRLMNKRVCGVRQDVRVALVPHAKALPAGDTQSDTEDEYDHYPQLDSETLLTINARIGGYRKAEKKYFKDRVKAFEQEEATRAAAQNKPPFATTSAMHAAAAAANNQNSHQKSAPAVQAPLNMSRGGLFANLGAPPQAPLPQQVASTASLLTSKQSEALGAQIDNKMSQSGLQSLSLLTSAAAAAAGASASAASAKPITSNTRIDEGKIQDSPKSIAIENDDKPASAEFTLFLASEFVTSVQYFKKVNQKYSEKFESEEQVEALDKCDLLPIDEQLRETQQCDDLLSSAEQIDAIARKIIAAMENQAKWAKRGAKYEHREQVAKSALLLRFKEVFGALIEGLITACAADSGRGRRSSDNNSIKDAARNKVRSFALLCATLRDRGEQGVPQFVIGMALLNARIVAKNAARTLSAAAGSNSSGGDTSIRALAQLKCDLACIEAYWEVVAIIAFTRSSSVYAEVRVDDGAGKRDAYTDGIAWAVIETLLCGLNADSSSVPLAAKVPVVAASAAAVRSVYEVLVRSVQDEQLKAALSKVCDRAFGASQAYRKRVRESAENRKKKVTTTTSKQRGAGDGARNGDGSIDDENVEDFLRDEFESWNNVFKAAKPALGAKIDEDDVEEFLDNYDPFRHLREEGSQEGKQDDGDDEDGDGDSVDDEDQEEDGSNDGGDAKSASNRDSDYVPSDGTQQLDDDDDQEEDRDDDYSNEVGEDNQNGDEEDGYDESSVSPIHENGDTSKAPPTRPLQFKKINQTPPSDVKPLSFKKTAPVPVTDNKQASAKQLTFRKINPTVV